ncbi:MAG: motility associated factor glycosyltransferase family protein [Lachnospiraceae bacterium]|nr:motility associated factor glycosyltransferase family protein [Lachnospiraceae bacterium]
MVGKLIEINEYAYDTVYNFRRQYYYTGWNACTKITEKLNDVIDDCVLTAGGDIVQRLGLPVFFDAMESGDEILIADVLEVQFIPTMESIIQLLEIDMSDVSIDYLTKNISELNKYGYEKLAEIIIAAKPRNDCQYIAEYTAAGYPTIKIVENGSEYYMSGNNNPVADAYTYADGNVNESIYKYSLLGVGLFFEAKAMLKLRPDIELRIVEEDPYLMKLAMTYVDVSGIIEDDRVKLIVEKYADYISRIDDADGQVLVRKPSIRHMSDDAEADVIARFFMNSMSLAEQRHWLDRNYRRNILLKNIKSVDECVNDFKGKKVYLVAGGPSLDLAMEMLAKREQDSVVLCVGTSLKKLMSEGITPEYAIITDAKDSMYSQLHGVIDKKKTKLLYLSTANNKAVVDFDGDRYMICQNGMPEAEKYAKSHGYKCFNTGGSVSTTAIDICIGLGCKEVVCMGLDLAFTDNKTHAGGTLDEKEISINSNITKKVRSVKGEDIYTSENLHSYHVWIEHRIENVKNVKFVNISNGAFIKGMMNLPVS